MSIPTDLLPTIAILRCFCWGAIVAVLMLLLVREDTVQMPLANVAISRSLR